MTQTFGRTNLPMPRAVLALAAPPHAADSWLTDLCDRAVATGLPLDISSSAALWGGGLRGTTSPLMAAVPDLSGLTTEESAFEQAQAHILQILSAVGRETLDFYAITVHRAWEEAAISGVLRAMEFAREEGILLHLGLRSGPSGLAALAVWQFHDAFEWISLPTPDVYAELRGLAQDRRVGVVVDSPPTGAADAVPRLTVRTPAGVDSALAQLE